MAWKDNFDEKYQDLVGMNSPEELHLNSLELVSVLEEFNLIKDDIHVFEIGSGGARNLKYINDKNSNIKLSANDLHKAASFENMDPTVREKINFYEIDTLNLVKTVNPEPIDILVASDHLMHIEEQDVKEILNVISNNWKPKYILIREIKPAGHKVNRKYPRIHHKINLPNYKLIKDINSKTLPNLYYVKLFKLLES